MATTMQTDASAGDNGAARSMFLQFFDEYDAADQTVAEAVGMRKDLRKRISGAKISLPAFDHCRKESRKSGEQREQVDRAYRTMMGWLGKPLGFSPPEAPPPPDDSSITEHQRRKIHSDGYDAGRAGWARDKNTWSPGSILYAIYDEGWREGAEALAQSQVAEPDQPKRRGRPPGSRNKPKPNSHDAQLV